jgi:hypothetical protein
MRIPGGLLFMWGVFPSFQFRVLVAVSQKKPDFGTPNMEKSTFFVVQNKNWPPWRSSQSQVPHVCPIWPRSEKLCQTHGRI